MPFIHEAAQLQAAISRSQYSIEKLYYVGELHLADIPEQRSGIAAVRSTGTSHTFSVQIPATCTVERPDDHLLKLEGYVPITRFLARTGFDLMPGVTTSFSWRETDSVRRDHPMQFWVK
jgi:hypothetical protein